MSAMSDRSFATFWKTYTVLNKLVRLGAITPEQCKQIIASAPRRKNGKLDVINFHRSVGVLLADTQMNRPELFQEQPPPAEGPVVPGS
jgi:hypothetical protein